MPFYAIIGFTWRSFKVVFESSAPGVNLFQAEHLRAMCRMDEDLIQPYVLPISGCPSVSVGTLVGIMLNKPCLELTDADVAQSLITLRFCMTWYANRSLNSECISTGCPSVPDQCVNHGEVFGIFHLLADYKFLDPETESDHLTFAMMLVALPYEDGSRWTDFYLNKLENGNLDNGLVKITGMDSYIKFGIFGDRMKAGMVYFLVAAMIIFAILCLYLKSLCLCIATVLDIIFSTLLAYFFYHIVFGFKFFPFINIFAMLILIAVGADDVFIFYDSWQLTKSMYPGKGMAFWLSKTMDHATMSILVTSLTTASAFCANFISEITSIKCFGMFACLCILCNFLMMVTWIPACMIISERFSKCCTTPCSRTGGFLDKVKDAPTRFSQFVFSKFFVTVINKLWFVWILLFLGIGVWGIVATMVTPKLRLPSSANFQTFMSDHPFERYDQIHKMQFRYFRQAAIEYGMRIVVEWGVQPLDNSNHVIPDDYGGHLVLDNRFNMTSFEAWTYMKNFCISLRQSNFSSVITRKKSCLLELFEDYITRTCGEFDLCCGYQLPIDSRKFSKCFKEFMSLPLGHADLIDLPFFDQNNKIVAYRLDIYSSQIYTKNYNEATDFYNKVDSFLQSQLEDAPNGVQHAWFVGDFLFYDLQRALSSGTFMAILVSLSSAAIVMLLTSLNILITLYAIVTIALAIFVTVGSLVMLDWELNILEAIIITSSVGLSIDFAIHYGVAYRLAGAPNRLDRVKHSLSSVGSPVAMASITTFLAGAAIYPAQLLCYRQLAIFLMLVMVTSWTFATFLFLSVCRIIGPQGNFAQIPSPFSCCIRTKKQVDNNSFSSDGYPKSCSEFPSTFSSDANISSDANRYSECSGSHLSMPPGGVSEQVPTVCDKVMVNNTCQTVGPVGFRMASRYHVFSLNDNKHNITGLNVSVIPTFM